MSCEKQFLPANNTFLYCSEACRLVDQAPSQPMRNNSYPSYTSSSPPLTPYNPNFSHPTIQSTEYPDIIPRFSPTQSRPRSYFNSDPYPQSYQDQPPSPTSTSHYGSTTALSSLRELATALPKTHTRERYTPPSPISSISRTSSSIFNYISFSSSKTSTPTPSATPGNSYPNTAGYQASQSYGGIYATRGSREDVNSYSYGNYQGSGDVYRSSGGMGMDRPLPPRGPPSHRPRSIDLVTPVSGF